VVERIPVLGARIEVPVHALSVSFISPVA